MGDRELEIKEGKTFGKGGWHFLDEKRKETVWWKGESIEREEKGDGERWPSRSAFPRGVREKRAAVEKRKKISESYYLGIEKRKQGEKKELVFLVWFQVE